MKHRTIFAAAVLVGSAAFLASARPAFSQDKAKDAKDAKDKKDDKKKLPQVLLKTNKGEILLELYEDEAPNTVANFISLVEEKFYDKTKFHRVIEGFMAQGGDPKGNGSGGPGGNINGAGGRAARQNPGRRVNRLEPTGRKNGQARVVHPHRKETQL